MPICEDTKQIFILEFDILQLIPIGMIIVVSMLHLDLLDCRHVLF